jgi:hypothetical protein
LAPARTHPEPSAQIVGLLAECRRRGLNFEEAWFAVVLGGGRIVLANNPRPPELAVRWPSDQPKRLEALFAINETKDAYERAYHREPPLPAERAVVGLFDLLDAVTQKSPETRTPGWGRTATAPAAHMRTRPPRPEAKLPVRAA